MLSHRHVHVWVDSSLAQNGFWCPTACPRRDGRDCVVGGHGKVGSWGAALLSCTLSPKQEGKRGLTPAEGGKRETSAREERLRWWCSPRAS